MKKVANMMQGMGFEATAPLATFKRPKKSSTSSYPNELNRAFHIGELNKLWVADITYICTVEGWAYLATVMDLGSRKIRGWTIDRHVVESLISEALRQALCVRKPEENWIHHLDQESQYTSTEYIKLLKEQHATINMSQKGTTADNACIEAFDSSIREECIYRQKIETIAEAKKLVEEYIASFYNERRRHSAICTS